MTALEQRAVFEVLDLELRQRGGGRSLSGRFPYRSPATVRDRGRVRKETFGSRAFAFAVEDEAREIHLLSGHSYDRPLASKRGGTLRLEDRDDGLSFEAELPDEAAQPSWMRDTVMALQAGLIGGISRLRSAAPECGSRCGGVDTGTRQSRRANSADPAGGAA